MAKQVQKGKVDKSKTQKKGGKTKVAWQFPLTRQNYIVLAIGIGIIILGYILMATGITEEPALPQGKWNNPLAIYVAPILLVIGYCVVIPYGLMMVFKKKPQDITTSEESQ
jgi:NADH:ubiquinone oxidoreductase subunit 6 (subunit J)